MNFGALATAPLLVAFGLGSERVSAATRLFELWSTTNPWTVSVPAFTDGVVDVVSLRPEKEVRRADARRGVTFVQNVEPCRDRPDSQFPSNAMGSTHAPSAS